jgi:hypothetical protein
MKNAAQRADSWALASRAAPRSRARAVTLRALYLPKYVRAGQRLFRQAKTILARGPGVLMPIVLNSYAMMLSHAAATGVPGYHERLRVTAAAAGQ